MLRNCVFTAALVFIAAAQAGFLRAAEVKIRRTQLPAAVRKAADELAKSSQVVGYSREEENGKVLYEVEMKANGLTKDVTFDEQGNTVSIEQEVAILSLPAPVLEGLRKAAGKERITKVESITKGTTVTYEAALKGGSSKEVTVDTNGTLVGRE